jgi:predicted CXXCH cytochrome family protein
VRSFVVAAALVAAAWGALLPGACTPPRAPEGRGLPSASRTPGPKSNILRADYVGSEVCGDCHPEVYEAWSRSPMRRMTRTARDAEIRSPFDGRTWRFKDDVVRLEEVGGDRYLRIDSRPFGQRSYRVTRVIGGRHREDFAGVEVSGIGPDARILGDPHVETLLPVSYVFETESFRLKGYSVMVAERPGLRAGGVWNAGCVGCHNTLPYFPAFWGVLQGPNAPGYQLSLVDSLLPADRRHAVSVLDETALRRAVEEEVRHLGGSLDAVANAPLPELIRQAIVEMRGRLEARHFVEVGIGCEACHGGGREHVERPSVPPSFEPRSPMLATHPDGDDRPVTRAEHLNRACARCHKVLFSRYPFTWEGGQRWDGEPGGSSINSGEARDLLLGGCGRQMACTVCHDPHAEDDPKRLARLATPEGNAVCTPCHQALAEPEALRRHAHHDPEGAGGACVACHMPRKNAALTYSLTRYHRIGSPTDPDRVEQDRPLECALCHPRESTEGLVATMERLWKKSYDRGALRELYGDLDRPPLIPTLTRGKSHEQMTAYLAVGEAGLREALPEVARGLTHPTPLVRYYAQKAFDALLEVPCPVDLDQHTAEIAAAVAGCLARAASPR